MKFFRIRDKRTGNFSMGGSRPTYGVVGHLFQEGPLKNHLQHVDQDTYESAELVEYHLTEVKVCDLGEFLNAVAAAAQARELKQELAHQDWRKTKDLEELDRLEKKYRGKK